MKTELRKRMRALVQAADRERESAQIRERLLPLIPPTGLILAYEHLADEPDIDALLAPLRSAGRLALVEGRGDAARIEPVGSVMLALVPGRAFDRHGNRLGRGGGTFDRILSTQVCPKIGVAFSCQLVAELPAEPHDVRMTRVVTAEEDLTVA